MLSIFRHRQATRFSHSQRDIVRRIALIVSGLLLMPALAACGLMHLRESTCCAMKQADASNTGRCWMAAICQSNIACLRTAQNVISYSSTMELARRLEPTLPQPDTHASGWGAGIRFRLYWPAPLWMRHRPLIFIGTVGPIEQHWVSGYYGEEGNSSHLPARLLPGYDSGYRLYSQVEEVIRDDGTIARRADRLACWDISQRNWQASQGVSIP